MKWLAAVLVLLNVAFAMWGVWFKDRLPADQAAQPPLHPERIRLLTEPGVTLERRPATPKSTALSCYDIGPFASQDLADTTRASLEALKLAVSTSMQSQTTVVGYRVAVGPFASAAEAERRRAELVRRKLKDVMVIAGSDRRFTVSLGVFSKPELAQQYQRELAGKGVHATTEEVSGTQTTYWLHASAAAAAPLAALARQTWPPGVGVRGARCSAGDAPG